MKCCQKTGCACTLVNSLTIVGIITLVFLAIGIPLLITSCDPEMHVCVLYDQIRGNLTHMSYVQCKDSNSQCTSLTFDYPDGSCVATANTGTNIISKNYKIGRTYTIWKNKIDKTCTYTTKGAMKAGVIVAFVSLSMV